MARTGKAKRKRDASSSEDDGDDVMAQRLAAYGERFLSMFDDADERAPQQQPAAAAASRGDDGSSGSDDGGSDGGGGDDQPADLVEQLFDSGKKGKQRSTFAAAAAAAAAATPGSRGADAPAAKRSAGPAGGAGGVPAVTPQAAAAAEAERLRAERRRFMSSKAAVITGEGRQQALQRRRRSSGAGTPGVADAAAEAGGLSREEFVQMQREVQLYGATALDKKAKKAFEAAQLQKLGAKAEARPRIPASIGFGMARKAAQRAERALQEGIAAGMIKAKGLGKKKRREKEKARKSGDRGLMEDGGAFRPGIMRVRPAGGSGGGSGARRR